MINVVVNVFHVAQSVADPSKAGAKWSYNAIFFGRSSTSLKSYLPNWVTLLCQRAKVLGR